MEPISCTNMSRNTITTVDTAANVTTSAGVELLLSSTRSSIPTYLASNIKTTGLYHDDNVRVLKHCCSNNILIHHQYPIQMAPSPIIPSLLIPSAQTSSLGPTSQLMLSTTMTTTPGSIPQFRQLSGSHQMVSASSEHVLAPITSTLNTSTVGTLRTFGISSNKRVAPNHIHHRHQHRKLSSLPFSKECLDTNRTSYAQISNVPTINSQHLYVGPTHLSNKMNQYDSLQQQQNRIKVVNEIANKNLPVLSSTYSLQPNEQCCEPRTSLQDRYFSVITGTAVTNTNCTAMNNIVTHSDYYQTLQKPLQTKTSDNYDRHNYHFDNIVSAIQSPQQQIDNSLFMGTPVQRSDPIMNLTQIVKNLQSVQSDIDYCTTSLFNQPSFQQQHQTYHNTVSTFNVPLSASGIHLNQQVLRPTHHNNFIVTLANPQYYNPTTTIVYNYNTTTVTTSSAPIFLNNLRHLKNHPQQNSNNYHDLIKNVHRGNYDVNDYSNSPSSPLVIFPNIEEESSYLCDDSMYTSDVKVKPLNLSTRKPSFIDNYTEFLHQRGTNSTITTKEDECPLALSTPKAVLKPYIPLALLPKPKVVSSSEQTSSPNIYSEDKKASNVSTKSSTSTIDDGPQYFPLPKTSLSIASISEDRSHGENSWLSSDDKQDHWRLSLSKGHCSASSTATSVTKNKKQNNTGTLKKKPTNSTTAIKKQKTQQPRRQLSHRLAKEKTKLLSSVNNELGMDDEDLLSDSNSNIYPAWKPNHNNKVSKNAKQCNLNHRNYSKVQCSNSEHLPSILPTISINNNIQTDDSTFVMPFKTGSFVALKSKFQGNELINPQHLWRVVGKSLLEKFQRCDEDNVYKSILTHIEWSPLHYNNYYQVAVKFVTSDSGTNIIPNKNEILVQLLCKNDDKKSTQINPADNTKNNSIAYSHTSEQKVNVFNSLSSINSTASIDDQNVILRPKFKVYIQTLLSQALDSTFLEIVFVKNDQFFISNFDAIESVTQSWVQAIESTTTRDLGTDLSKVENIRTMITKFPIMEMCSVIENSVNNMQLCCIVCGSEGLVEKQKKFVEISLSGTEYNLQTLRTINLARRFLKIIPMKQVHCCSNTRCVDELTILHSLVHLKYHIYKECCKRMIIENDNISNISALEKITLLRKLVNDDEWIEKLFQMVCNIWSLAKKFVPNS